MSVILVSRSQASLSISVSSSLNWFTDVVGSVLNPGRTVMHPIPPTVDEVEDISAVIMSFTTPVCSVKYFDCLVCLCFPDSQKKNRRLHVPFTLPSRVAINAAGQRDVESKHKDREGSNGICQSINICLQDVIVSCFFLRCLSLSLSRRNDDVVESGFVLMSVLMEGEARNVRAKDVSQ